MSEQEGTTSELRLREAIAFRLDVRCGVRWRFIPEQHTRCGRCDGCIAWRWVEDGMPPLPHREPPCSRCGRRYRNLGTGETWCDCDTPPVDVCDDCAGTGAQHYNGDGDCPSCGGTGKRPPADECPDCNAYGQQWHEVPGGVTNRPCTTCGGRKFKGHEAGLHGCKPKPCPSCGGTGDRPEHLYEGDCPVEGMWDARDPHCPACQVMDDRPAVTRAEVQAAVKAWEELRRDDAYKYGGARPPLPDGAVEVILEAAAAVRDMTGS